MVRMWEQTSLLGRQEKKHASVWKRTPFSKCSLLRKENSCIPFTGCKTGSLLRMDRKRWGPDVEYWLDSSNTCRPHLIPHHTLRATSGLLCHRDVLHGLHTLHTYPLCLTRVWGLLTGPLEISFNRKMTPNGQKRKKKKKPPHPPLPSSVGYSFLCKWRPISHLHLQRISTYGKSTVPGVEEEGCWGMEETKGRESLQTLLSNLQDVNRLNEVLFNSFQDISIRVPHYKAWKKKF